MSTHTRTYSDKSHFQECLISSVDTSITIDPLGAYVTSWDVDGQDILYIGSSKKRTGIPLLFPYFGKSKMGRQHGFARDSTWALVAQSEVSVVLELSRSDIDDQAKSEYPYDFLARITIGIDGTSLLYSLAVSNRSDRQIPVLPGLHPYWAVNHDKKNSIKTSGIEGFDASKIDWTAQPPDTDFPFVKKIELQFPSYGLTIEDISAPAVVKQTTIWSQSSDKADYNFVCFEPICGVRGGIDSSPVLIAPNGIFKMDLKFTVTV